MAFNADDLVLSMKIQYARTFVELFERLLKEHIRSNKTVHLPRFQHSFWTHEATRTLRYAFFLRYFALFEAHLTTICDRIRSHENLTLAITDLRGETFLSTFDKYLVKVVGLPSPTSLVAWKEITIYAQIRNIIMHRDGYLKDINSYVQVREFAKKTKTIRIDRDNRISLNKPFAYRVLSHMSEFLSQLNTMKI